MSSVWRRGGGSWLRGGLAILAVLTVLGATPDARGMDLGTNFWNLNWHKSGDCFRDVKNVTGDDPWNPQFLAEIAIYRSLRFMDWDNTNGSQRESWPERPQKTALKQNPVAYEWMIDLCNRMNADMWVTVPHRTINHTMGDEPSDYGLRLCLLVKTGVDMGQVDLQPLLPRLIAMTARELVQAGGVATCTPLKPALRLYVEYSNETWNGGFQQSHYCCDEGMALKLDEKQWTAGFRFHAWAAIRLFRAADLVFGVDSPRVVRVLATQSSNSWIAGQHQQVMKDARFNPWGVRADAIAIAPYFGHKVPGDAPDAAAQLRDGIRKSAQDAARHRKIADEAGLKLIAYEGGQHVLSKAKDINRNPVMFELYQEYLGEMARYIEHFSHYCHVGQAGDRGAWGAIEYTGQSLTEAHKYRALVEWSRSNPPAAAPAGERTGRDGLPDLKAGENDGGPSLPVLGRIRPHAAREIASSSWSVGGETLDRDFAAYAKYRDFLGPLGAKRIRLQAGWAKCEKQPGVYDWAWLDEVVDDALSQGVQPWLETSYGNPIYPGGGDSGLGGGLPASAEALAAWDNWVRALVRRYRERVREWEIWNEPDLNKANRPEAYGDLFLRTARIIRAEQPQARIWALALARDLAFAEKFLIQVQQAGGTDWIDAVTVHSYPLNPDDTSLAVKMRALLAQYAPQAAVRQGETGAPSTSKTFGALRGHPWTELTQAKWDLRRMLAHHGMDVPFNLFTLMELRYPTGMNTKGLLKANADGTVAYAKPAYYAAQNVFAVFDNSLVRVTDFSCKAGIADPLAAFAYARQTTGAAVVTLWLKGVAPRDSNTLVPADLELAGVKFVEPVYADLLTGRVYAIPRDRWSVTDGTTTFRQIPLYDAPVLIAEKTVLE